MQNTTRVCRPAHPWVAKRNKIPQTSATLSCKAQCNGDIQGSVSEALTCQYNVRSNSKNVKCTFRYRFAWSTHRILREGSSSKMKMRISLQRRAFKNFEMDVSLQQRAQKSKQNSVSPQFRAIDPTNPARGFIEPIQTAHIATAMCSPKSGNARFTTGVCPKVYATCRDVRGQPRPTKISFYHSFERPAKKFSFYHSFERPTRTKCWAGRSAILKICVSPLFWGSNTHEVTKGSSLTDLKNLRFTTVLSVRRARSDERVLSRGGLPNLPLR